MALQLKSPAFANGEEIPKKYTCEGEDISPPLEWEDAPAGTRSFALVCTDPDAPGGTFMHWAAFDIPADRRRLEEGFGPESKAAGFRQAVNDFKKPGYGGPCPPEGHGPHHYHFRLTALSEETLPLAPGCTVNEVIQAIKPYILDQVEYVGTYER